MTESPIERRGGLTSPRAAGGLTMIDSFLFDAGSVFLAAWALTLTSLCVVAFGRDLLPSKATLHPAERPRYMAPTPTDGL